MDVRELDGQGSAAAAWRAPKLVMLTAIGNSEGGILFGVAERSQLPTKNKGFVNGSVYGVSG